MARIGLPVMLVAVAMLGGDRAWAVDVSAPAILQWFVGGTRCSGCLPSSCSFKTGTRRGGD